MTTLTRSRLVTLVALLGALGVASLSYLDLGRNSQRSSYGEGVNIWVDQE